MTTLLGATKAARLGTYGSGVGELRWPRHAVVADGELYCADGTNHCVVVFRLDGRHLRSLGAPGDGPGQLESPHAVAIVGDRVLVADHGNHRIACFSRGGRWLGAWGAPRGRATTATHAGSAASASAPLSPLLSFPHGLAVSGEHVLVASTGANEIVSFALADGAPLSRFGAVAQSLEAHLERRFRGSPGAPRQLNWPKAVAADRDRVYVADSANHCVKIFEAGVLIDSWGGRGAADGLFEFPGGIGVYDGHVFVAEARGRRVQAFSLSGRFVAKMRPAGCGDLAGLSVDAQHVYVADESESCVWLLPRVGPRGILNAEREASCGVADRETL